MPYLVLFAIRDLKFTSYMQNSIMDVMLITYLLIHIESDILQSGRTNYSHNFSWSIEACIQ